MGGHYCTHTLHIYEVFGRGRREAEERPASRVFEREPRQLSSPLPAVPAPGRRSTSRSPPSQRSSIRSGRGVGAAGLDGR